MTTVQGDLSLLETPVAQALLQSTQPAQLAYVWPDGTPRVTPVWFFWNGRTLVVGSPPKAPKVKALTHNSKVALTINEAAWPYKVLLIRGTAQIETIDGVNPEYAASAIRYFGEEQGKAWAGQIDGMFTQWTRIEVQPEWVGVLDFESRFPNAIEAAMAG